MSVREYLSVFVSIIVGLAVADLLISLHKLIRGGSRVRWYWLAPALTFYMLLVIMSLWWGTFLWLGHVSSLSIAEFLPTLMVAIAIFLLAAAVLPDEIPEGGIDLKAWYFGNASQIWLLAAIGLSLTMINGADFQATVLKDSGRFSWPLLGQRFIADEWDNVLTLVACIWLIFSKRPRIHEAVIIVGLIDMVYSAAVFRIG
ncbi:MAG TPA: hypothetical protein VFN81_04550 [Sphingomicrobium sp.]|nr:hypothetical protein [Sphingomicrobium sp.]